MPRPLRVQYPHACYHVMNRGAGRRKIFKTNAHRQMFLNLLAKCHELFNLKIYAYCLMDNHYHLLVATPDANLPRIMKYINGVYTQKYNFLTNTDGALFRGRYHAKLVEEDCYQLIVSRYIHLNPVDAGIVSQASDYAWSSYPAYLSAVSAPKWLNISTILNQLSQTKLLAKIKSYCEYVEDKNIDEINTYISTKHSGFIVGSQLFKEKIISNLDDQTVRSCVTEAKRARLSPDISIIKKVICDYYKIDNSSFMQLKKGRRNYPKLIFMFLCKNKFGHTLPAIAASLCYQRYEAVGAAVGKFELILNKRSDLMCHVEEIVVQIRQTTLGSDVILPPYY